MRDRLVNKREQKENTLKKLLNTTVQKGRASLPLTTQSLTASTETTRHLCR